MQKNRIWLTRLLSAHFCSILRFLWIVALPISILATVLMSSAGWQRKHPVLLFMLLMKALNTTDPSINPSCKSDGESAEHYSWNQASLLPKLLFTSLVQISAIWLPGRMMKWDEVRTVVRIYLDCILAVADGHDLPSLNLCWQFLVAFLGFVCLEMVSR